MSLFKELIHSAANVAQGTDFCQAVTLGRRVQRAPLELGTKDWVHYKQLSACFELRLVWVNQHLYWLI